MGVVAAGKAWQDVLQAIGNLGSSEERAGEAGLRLLKVGMVWPLDPAIVRDFARGLEAILVVEEKRPLIEDQIRAILYGQPNPPRIVGKYFDGVTFDPAHGAPAFPNCGETTPEMVALRIVETARAVDSDTPLAEPRWNLAGPNRGPSPLRMPGFCAGCPHNRSTRVPDGSRALAGIGCHWMATLVAPEQTTTASHMGGEGAMWLGQQPFTSEKHVFANIGDGTYAHSGSLAIRQAVAAKVPITYKILFNGFVSMTGGQPVEGGQTPAQILSALAGEGVRKMALLTDDPDRYLGIALPRGRRGQAARRTRGDAEGISRLRGRLRHSLRPALRHRAPALTQARTLARPAEAHVHQRRGLRGLRRLRQSVELHGDRAARDRVRAQAAHQSGELQQGFLLHRGFLPELRHRAWRTARRGRRRSPAPAAKCLRSPSLRCRSSTTASASCSPASAARAW